MTKASYRAIAAWLLLCVIFSCYPGGVLISYAAESAAEAVAVAPIAELQDGQRSDFIMGADVSELYEIMKSGKKFYDTDGTEMSAMQVLKNHGVNYLRLRIWNDPTDAFGRPIGGGNNDLANDMVIAKEAQALGMKVLLDFHYSDFWADPGKQNKPKAWASHSGTALENDVFHYTHDVLTAMKNEGVLPDMVQIGNEINGGLLWPDGNSPAKAAPFLQKASAAVRAVDPGIQIMIHIAGNSSGSTGTFTWNLDTWTTGGTAVDFDVIGISHYPYWHGTMAQSANILNTLASKYGKPVVVAETAYAWTLDPGDETINNFDQSSADTAGYTPTPQGQAAAIRDVIDNVAKVPGNQGLGLFYWGADWLPGNDTGWISGQGSGWENQALFDYQGKALPSVDVFNLVRGADAVPSPVFVQADPAHVTMESGGDLHLPSAVKGQYSDGFYKSVAVTAWDISTVNKDQPGVYIVHGTIGSDPDAATVVLSVHSIQPPNLLTNPGLESGSTGWTVTAPSVAQPQGTGSTPHTGGNAVHYWSGSDFADAKVSQTISVDNGTYTFSAWIDGDPKNNAAVPFLYAVGYDSSNPSAMITVDAVPAGWNNFKQYSLQVPVTSGQVTVGVNVKGTAEAWGDVDDFYFGLPAAADLSTQAQPAAASAGGIPLSGNANVPSNSEVTLSSATDGATIYYTTDGSDPGYASNTSTTLVYTGPITIEANMVLQTMAVKSGYSNSSVNLYRVHVDESGMPGLVPDGSFEQEGSLGAWTLSGAAQGSVSGSHIIDAVHDTGDGKVYAGAGYFNYWSKDASAFQLSQTITGLQNGVYLLSAQSAGKSNLVTDAAGRAVNDPAISALSLAAITPDGAKSTNVINQGQADTDWHNVWGTFSVPGIRVTDGKVTVNFSVDASADYWGYLDRVTLVKTGELPDTTAPAEVAAAVVAAGDGQLRFSWTDPSDGDLQKVQLVRVGTTVTDAVYINKGLQQALITGLTNGTSYSYKLKTIDTAGNESVGVTVTGIPAKAESGNGSGSGGNSGGGTTPSGPQIPPATVADGSVKVTPVTDTSGVATVMVNPADVATAIRSASGKTLAIEVSPSAGTKEVRVDLPVAQFKADGIKAIDTIEVDTGFAVIAIATDLVRKSAGTAAASLQLSVSKVDPASLPAAIQTQLGDRTILDITLSVGGNKLIEFGRHDVKISIPYTLKPGDNPNQIVIYYLTDDGKLEVVKNGQYDQATGKVEFKAKHLSKYAVAYAEIKFSDASKAAWASDAIEVLAARGAINGVGHDRFDPDGAVTRAEFVTILMQALDLAVNDQDSSFPDAREGEWYSGAVAAAQKLGIVSGKKDGSFGVNDWISRQDMAVMVYNAAKVLQTRLDIHQTSAEFADQSLISPYAVTAVSAMKQSGLISGVGGNKFAPKNQSTRAQAAVIVYRLFSLTSNGMLDDR